MGCVGPIGRVVSCVGSKCCIAIAGVQGFYPQYHCAVFHVHMYAAAEISHSKANSILELGLPL